MAMTCKPCGVHRIGNQAGFVLIAALMFLLLLTVLGLAASRTASVEVMMASSFRDMDRAFSATEAALRDAEIHIMGYSGAPVNPYGFNSNCTDGLCDSVANIPSLDFFGAASPGRNSVPLGTTTGSPTLAGVANQPRYLIEDVSRSSSYPGASEVRPGGGQRLYRITAQGTGLKTSTRITLQEVYVR